MKRDEIVREIAKAEIVREIAKAEIVKDDIVKDKIDKDIDKGILVNNKVFIVVLVIGLIADVFGPIISIGEYVLEKEKNKMAQQEQEFQQQQEELARQEKEEKKRPQPELVKGDIVCYGNEKYQVLHILNTNPDAAIKSGTLVVQYRIRGQNENTSIDCYLDGAIYDETVDYIVEQDGSTFCLRKDCEKFPEMTEKWLEVHQVNVEERLVFQPYLFIYYEYTCEGENLDGYYRIEIEKHGFGAVEEIDEPENYFNTYEIKIEEVLI